MIWSARALTNCIPRIPICIPIKALAMAEVEQVDSQNSMDPELESTVLEVKDEYTYVIPSFCVISTKLRRAHVRFFRLDNVHTVDVFFRVGDTLPGFSAVLPARAKVIQGVAISVSIHFSSYNKKRNDFAIQTEEFSGGIITDSLGIDDETVFVAYKWR